VPVDTDLAKKTRRLKQLRHPIRAGLQMSVIETIPRYGGNPNQAGQISHDLGCSSNDEVAQF
jgi:hypothetical protein